MSSNIAEDSTMPRFTKNSEGKLLCKSKFLEDYVPVEFSDEESIRDIAEFREGRDIMYSVCNTGNLGNPQDFVVNGEDQDDECEEWQDYGEGGYHPVCLGDIYIKRFEVKKKLGWGQFSTVWLCWDHRERSFVAAKIVRSLEKYAHAGLCELDLLQKISHRGASRPGHNNLLKLFGGFSFKSVNGSHIGIVTEALGCHLLKLILNSPKGLPIYQVRNITKQVLLGLEALHHYKIMHSDIKPENILVELSKKDICLLKQVCGIPLNEEEKQNLNQPDDALTQKNYPQIKIADFSNAFDISEPYEGKIQTRQYRAIEVIIGAKYGTPADIWSTACMAYELATGNYLFNPEKGTTYQMEDHHLSLIAQALGPIPNSVFETGEYHREFFSKKTGKLRHVNLPQKMLTEMFPAAWAFKKVRPFAAFLKKMLIYDTKERVTARDALKDDWLNSEN